MISTVEIDEFRQIFRYASIESAFLPTPAIDPNFLYSGALLSPVSMVYRIL
jgi:hypothetical protein